MKSLYEHVTGIGWGGVCVEIFTNLYPDSGRVGVILFYGLFYFLGGGGKERWNKVGFMFN